MSSRAGTSSMSCLVQGGRGSDSSSSFNPRFRQRHFPSKATCDLRQEGSDPQVKVKLEQTFPEPRVKKSSGGFNLYVDRQTRRGRGKRQKRPVRDDRPLTQSEECEPSGAAGRTVPPVRRRRPPVRDERS
ncbi:Hypothetical protein SMAX5B_017722 [Scophthalmus maximus]|uniref:Uncharacterized protein n=1 Tax=Scophthalmus maximus TaxID=52904 RepID=A0A2U9CDJ0_SCOMX|nr:Hypothetical protein SMAX5B_017722 [Scophthalmus maximus]